MSSASGFLDLRGIKRVVLPSLPGADAVTLENHAIFGEDVNDSHARVVRARYYGVEALLVGHDERSVEPPSLTSKEPQRPTQPS
jgi:hypothetical protein